MTAYVATTGIVFGMLTLAHIARMITEDSRFATDPSYLAITTVAAGLCGWAAWLLWRRSRV
jgi:hypothetical protein